MDNSDKTPEEIKAMAQLLDYKTRDEDKNFVKIEKEDIEEAMFEAEEKRHHIRRGFEHLYRSMVQSGVSSEGPTEYLMQYGVHPQQATLEVMGYIKHTEQRIIKGERLKGSDCEDFLDKMADRYLDCADDVSERIFGKTETTNTDYMRLLEAAE